MNRELWIKFKTWFWIEANWKPLRPMLVPGIAFLVGFIFILIKFRAVIWDRLIN